MERPPRAPIALMFNKDRSVLTVSELTKRIKSLLETGAGYVWVSGEVSNLRIAYSSHHYFTLKDAASQIRCVLKIII